MTNFGRKRLVRILVTIGLLVLAYFTFVREYPTPRWPDPRNSVVFEAPGIPPTETDAAPVGVVVQTDSPPAIVETAESGPAWEFDKRLLNTREPDVPTFTQAWSGRTAMGVVDLSVILASDAHAIAVADAVKQRRLGVGPGAAEIEKKSGMPAAQQFLTPQMDAIAEFERRGRTAVVHDIRAVVARRAVAHGLTLVLDRTATSAYGTPLLVDVENLPDLTPEVLREIAGADLSSVSKR